MSIAEDNGPAPRRQPGSWSNKYEIVSMEGQGAAEARPGLQTQMDQMSAKSVCVTPAMSASESPNDLLKLFGASEGCTFDKKDLTGREISMSGTCNSAKLALKVAVTGSLSPTMQDVTLSLDSTDTGPGARHMKMKVHSVRTGECSDKDSAPSNMMR